MPANPPSIEVDPRFPTGEWTGFFMQPRVAGGQHSMNVTLLFRAGIVTGEGTDLVGEFTIRGRYSIANGEVNFHKFYTGRHAVLYHGYNEGKGIWGSWELTQPARRGGFHLWPKSMPDPTQARR